MAVRTRSGSDDALQRYGHLKFCTVRRRSQARNQPQFLGAREFWGTKKNWVWAATYVTMYIVKRYRLKWRFLFFLFWEVGG